jgi:hypothetical protein
MRTTLTLDDDIYQMAKSLSEQSRLSIGAVVSRLARKGLSRGSEGTDDLGLPVFTDACLPGLAAAGNGRLITFDRKIADLLHRSPALESHLIIVES